MGRISAVLALAIVAVTVYLCEYAVFDHALEECTWPPSPPVPPAPPAVDGVPTPPRTLPIRVMLIADTHVLGNKRGHWLDRLRRERMMRTAYSRAVAKLRPDVSVFLGDLFDEGTIASDDEFVEYVARFRAIFAPQTGSGPSWPGYATAFMDAAETPAVTVAIAGNHDIGMHGEMSPQRMYRFERFLSGNAVDLFRVGGHLFMRINSMAIRMGECICSECTRAERLLQEMVNRLAKVTDDTGILAQPVVLSHFPFDCPQSTECPEPKRRDSTHRPGHDYLSSASTNHVISLLHPRAIFSGHTHHWCSCTHRGRIRETTVTSFNWRNTDRPGFLLVTLGVQAHELSSVACHLPSESNVLAGYACGFGLAAVVFFVGRRFGRSGGKKKVHEGLFDDHDKDKIF